MKLKSYIFRWVTLVTLLPATVLGLFATYYVQNLYHQDATDDIQRNLENISAEVSRSLLADQNLIISLAESKAVQQFLPVLDLARSSQLHSDYNNRIAILTLFLEQYQSVIALFDTFRVMDIRGNSLLKVKPDRNSITFYESVEPYLIMDKEIFIPDYIKLLSGLPMNAVSFIELPQTRDELGDDYNSVIPDAVVPLIFNNQRVGYLAVTINGSHIDQLLELAVRLYNGNLLIAEIDEENELRNGQVLYDEDNINFSQEKSTLEKLQNKNNGMIWEAFQKQAYGTVNHVTADTHYYYMEYFPYPNSLASWIIVSEVDDKVFSSTFERIRAGIWILTAIAVFSSLFFANYASRSISTPILKLAENLKNYADGGKAISIKSNIDEMQESSQSFTYMAKKLEQEQYERKKVETRMIQNAKLASLGQMAAGIGHEINNPLNNIRSLSRLIRRDLENNGPAAVHDKLLANMLEDLYSLDEEVSRASDIVQGVLSFARQTPEKELVSINFVDLLKNLDGLVRHEAKRYQVVLTGLDSLKENDELMIKGDQGKLQQALINITLNAIHANASNLENIKADDSRKNEVEFCLYADKEKVELTIQDQGAGIDQSIKDKIFDPFFTTKEVGQGTGLGLSISLTIIQNHHGQLLINNVENGGAMVKILLPTLTPNHTQQA